MSQLEIKGERALLEGRVASEETRCSLPLSFQPHPLPLVTLGINEIKELVLSKEILKSGADAAFVASFSVRYVRSHRFVAEALSEAETSCLKSNTVLQFLRGNRGGRKNICIQSFPVNISVCVTDASLTPIYQNEPKETFIRLKASSPLRSRV